MPEILEQPPLPFDPPVQLASPPVRHEEEHELPPERVTALLFEELARRLSGAEQ
ncbi:MAG TPA: hypothetical protein VIL25_09845 [Vicinamibacterales bacterium]